MLYKLYDKKTNKSIEESFFIAHDFSRILILLEIDIDTCDAYLKTFHLNKQCSKGWTYGNKYILKEKNE